MANPLRKIRLEKQSPKLESLTNYYLKLSGKKYARDERIKRAIEENRKHTKDTSTSQKHLNNH